jgi:hypothetical protein
MPLVQCRGRRSAPEDCCSNGSCPSMRPCSQLPKGSKNSKPTIDAIQPATLSGGFASTITSLDDANHLNARTSTRAEPTMPRLTEFFRR